MTDPAWSAAELTVAPTYRHDARAGLIVRTSGRPR